MTLTVTIECRDCGTLRPHKFIRLWDYWAALERRCLSCATTAFAYDVDTAAVERLLAGDKIPARPGELAEAVAYLTRSGRSARVIAERIGCSHRTVTRHRSRMANQ